MSAGRFKIAVSALPELHPYENTRNPGETHTVCHAIAEPLANRFALALLWQRSVLRGMPQTFPPFFDPPRTGIPMSGVFFRASPPQCYTLSGQACAAVFLNRPSSDLACGARTLHDGFFPKIPKHRVYQHRPVFSTCPGKNGFAATSVSGRTFRFHLLQPCPGAYP